MDMQSIEDVMVFRLTESTLNVDGLLVIGSEDVRYHALCGTELSIIRLTAIYKFLAQEELEKRKKFGQYVDRIIDKLIYNK
jgi:hypothetical protein